MKGRGLYDCSRQTEAAHEGGERRGKLGGKKEENQRAEERMV
jgi:hypothetical protein